MTKKLTELNEAQANRMASWAREWIEYGWRTTPLTEEEWSVWEGGVRKCYEYASIPWPNVVVRVPSPIVGAFAAPIAAYLIPLLRKRGAVGGAVGDAVHDAVRGAVRGAVGGAVGGAVHDAVGGAVRKSWYFRIGGRLWPNWQAYVAFFRDIVELQLPDDIWDRSRAYEAAQSAGWWWPFRDFVMVCDNPTELHVERVGPDGWGSHRMHCENGPAASWSDGWGVYTWHGVTVPAWVINEPSVEKAMAERNTEVRRAAFEAIGWGNVMSQLDEQPIDVCQDPANRPHHLELYRLPDKVNPYGQPVNLLVMTNGSPDRSGELRRYGETVPASIEKADAAAAWQYGIDSDVYRQLARRT
jgi:hypothetical protein